MVDIGQYSTILTLFKGRLRRRPTKLETHSLKRKRSKVRQKGGRKRKGRLRKLKHSSINKN
jgi:hypothetical protein